MKIFTSFFARIWSYFVSKFKAQPSSALAVTVGNVCFIRDRAAKKVLLLERAREPLKGFCTGVGGKTNFLEDIRTSCSREVKEETGLEVMNVQLKGVLKTIFEGNNTSWILFVYTADAKEVDCEECNEGTLFWIDEKAFHAQPMIGFIREIFPYVLQENCFFEGTVCHDAQ